MLIEDVGSRLKGVKDILVVDASKLDGVTANKLRLSMRKKKISALACGTSWAAWRSRTSA